MEDKKPFKVSQWWNVKADRHGEVWWNGKDGYQLWIDGKLIDTWNVYLIKEWGETHAHLIAVGEACRMGYKLTMGQDWPYKER